MDDDLTQFKQQQVFSISEFSGGAELGSSFNEELISSDNIESVRYP
jgi:hypothetical protein